MMVRHWIMNSRSNAFAFQKFRQRVTPVGRDDVHMINVPRPRAFGRNPHYPFKPIVVARGDVAPVIIQFVDVTQLDPADRGLKFIEPKIVTDEIVDVFRAAAVIAQHSQLSGECGVVRGDATAISHDG